jgi:four helix bundle protein
MDAEILSKRTTQFAIQIIHFYNKLPVSDVSKIIGKQLLRAGTSVAANYRAARRARSDDEFFSKISIVIEECDEAHFWLELICEAQILTDTKDIDLMKSEALELIKIFSTTRKTLKNRLSGN